jgi:Uma2 family endonuclease
MHPVPRQISGALRLTPAQFAELCEANPEAVLELEPDGRLATMTRAGGTTGARNTALVSLLWLAARQAGLPLKVFVGFPRFRAQVDRTILVVRG